jgi:uncharacterized protein (DUF305 family)
MNRKVLTAIAALALLTSVGASHAQTDSYPAVCQSDMKMPAPTHSEDMMSGMMKDHQKAAMAGMMKMDSNMMQGMMKDDADVAFVCGMIAHHQGAIDMANVELQHGDNAWAKEMAQKVIDAQTKEIAEMIGWLKDNAK